MCFKKLEFFSQVPFSRQTKDRMLAYEAQRRVVKPIRNHTDITQQMRLAPLNLALTAKHAHVVDLSKILAQSKDYAYNIISREIDA